MTMSGVRWSTSRTTRRASGSSSAMTARRRSPARGCPCGGAPFVDGAGATYATPPSDPVRSCCSSSMWSRPRAPKKTTLPIARYRERNRSTIPSVLSVPGPGGFRPQSRVRKTRRRVSPSPKSRGVSRVPRHRACLPYGTAGSAQPRRRRPGKNRFVIAPPEPARVSVVIPTLNEAENVPHVLARLPAWLDEVILVDAHSTDGTVEVARRVRPGLRGLQQSGHGKGNALAEGCAAATGDIIVTLDADGSTDPAEIPRFVAALRTGADFVKGSRFAPGGASSDITPTRRLGNRALRALVNLTYGT